MATYATALHRLYPEQGVVVLDRTNFKLQRLSNIPSRTQQPCIVTQFCSYDLHMLFHTDSPTIQNGFCICSGLSAMANRGAIKAKLLTPSREQPSC